MTRRRSSDGAGRAQAGRRPFTAVETQCLAPGYLRALCRYARRFGVGAVVAMTGEWDRQTLFDYREWGFEREPWEYAFARRKREAVRRAMETVHGCGLEFHVWRHELSMHPEHIRALNPAILDYTYGGGRKAGPWGEGLVDADLGFFDPRGDALWDYVAWRFDHLFELFPDLDGIFLTCLTETKLPLRALAKDMGETEILGRLLGTAIRACRRRGKQLVVRNWGAYRDPLRPLGHVLPAALEAIGAPDDVLVMEKSIEPDFAPGYPPNAGIAATARRRPTLVELELAGETEGGATVPACLPRESQAAIRYALGCGCAGFVARADSWADTIQWTRTHRTLGTVNEINLYACLRLMREPELAMETVWRDWARERFGAAAADVVRLLEPTAEAALNLFTCGRTVMGECEGLAPDRVLGNLRRYSRALYTGLPEDLAQRDALERLSDDDIRARVAEKQAAARMYRAGLAEVRELEGRIPGAWFDRFRAAFEHAAELAGFYADYTEALLRAARCRTSGSPEEPARGRAAIRRARGRLARARLPNRHLLLDPDPVAGTVAVWRRALDELERALAMSEHGRHGVDRGGGDGRSGGFPSRRREHPSRGGRRRRANVKAGGGGR